jgi:PAS domain S-box-containing protein
LAAIQLQSAGADLAFIWVVHIQPHRFTDGEIRYLTTLASQAVLAVSNAGLYLTAEVGKRRLESVLASTPEPVLVAGEEGKLLMVNQAAEQLYELLDLSSETEETRGEIISQTLRNFLMGTSPSESKVEEIALEDNKTYLVSVSPVEVEGQHVGKVCVLSDVTEYKQLEKMKNEYVSTVSHDLKAPLSLIRGYTSMLPMVGDVNDQQREYTNKIIETVDDITRMADELLDMRRIDARSLIDVQTISPAEILTDVVEEMQPQILNRKIQVMPELTLSQDATVEADRVLLQRAIFNLLDNAVKFSPLGGQVNLRLKVSEKSVTFVIQDHGPGIAPLDLPRIFDRVKRTVNKDGSVQQESGLGLSIVKSIAERHQGRVWAESQLGKGSTFYLEIPLRYAEKN